MTRTHSFRHSVHRRAGPKRVSAIHPQTRRPSSRYARDIINHVRVFTKINFVADFRARPHAGIVPVEYRQRESVPQREQWRLLPHKQARVIGDFCRARVSRYAFVYGVNL